MSELYAQLETATAALRDRLDGRTPSVGLILGSGLGSFADRLERPVAVPYATIPHLPAATVHGHQGRFVVGELGGISCIAMQGRVHMYEGHSAATVALPARIMARLGVHTVIVTNAAGGLRPEWEPGTLMLISDHLDFLRDHPLRGPNDERLGPRFPDMTEAYCPELRAVARKAAAHRGVTLAEGVYVAMPGPTYETPAEVRMLQRLGADATGMSTVPEVVALRHMGVKVLGISCITNKAAGITGQPLSHDEVTEVATQVRATFANLLHDTIVALGAST